MFLLFSFVVFTCSVYCGNTTTTHIIDFEKSAKTFGPGFTEIVKDIGTGLAAGTKEWARSGEQTGANIGNAITGGVGSFVETMGALNIHAKKAAQETGNIQNSFLTEYNTNFFKNVAPQIIKLKRGVYDILINPRDILYYSSLVGSSALIVGALSVTGWHGTRVLWSYIESRLKKPKIFTRWVPARSWYQSIKRRILGTGKNLNMIFDETVSQKLHDLIDITTALYTGKIKSSYSNILLYGAPGTGKTLFARYFAEQVGMEYAETTGGAFLQEGAGIEAVNSIFDYAKKTKGLILFIDEADSLFVDRNQLAVGQNAYKYEVLNHFLNLLGEPNNKLMVICATNHPVVFDEAMSRRFSQAIEMPLPGEKARQKLFELYLSRLEESFDKGAHEKEFVSKIVKDEKFIAWCVSLSSGMSGSDIETVIRLFGTDLALHSMKKSDVSFDAYKIMQAKIAEYRQKMILLKKDQP